MPIAPAEKRAARIAVAEIRSRLGRADPPATGQRVGGVDVPSLRIDAARTALDSGTIDEALFRRLSKPKVGLRAGVELWFALSEAVEENKRLVAQREREGTAAKSDTLEQLSAANRRLSELRSIAYYIEGSSGGALALADKSAGLASGLAAVCVGLAVAAPFCGSGSLPAAVVFGVAAAFTNAIAGPVLDELFRLPWASDAWVRSRSTP